MNVGIPRTLSVEFAWSPALAEALRLADIAFDAHEATAIDHYEAAYELSGKNPLLLALAAAAAAEQGQNERSRQLLAQAVGQAQQWVKQAPALHWTWENRPFPCSNEPLELVSERRLACRLNSSSLAFVDLTKGTQLAGLLGEEEVHWAEEHRVWGAGHGTAATSPILVTHAGVEYRDSSAEDVEPYLFVNPTNVQSDGDPAGRAARSPDGRYLGAVSGAAVKLWRIADRKLVWKARGPWQFADQIAFSPDGRTVAVSGTRLNNSAHFASDNSYAVVFAVASGQERCRLKGEEPSHWRAGSTGTPIADLAWFADSRRLATAYGTSVRVWDTAGCKKLERLTFETEPSNRAPTLRISPDSQWILVETCFAGGAMVLSMRGGAPQFSSIVHGWTFSPQGQWLYAEQGWEPLHRFDGKSWVPVSFAFVLESPPENAPAVTVPNKPERLKHDVVSPNGSRALDMRYLSNEGQGGAFRLRVWELPSNCLLNEVTVSVDPRLRLEPSQCTLDDQAEMLRCSRRGGTVGEEVTVDLVKPDRSRRALLFDQGQVRLESSLEGRQVELQGHRRIEAIPNVSCRIGPWIFPLAACPGLIERQRSVPATH